MGEIRSWFADKDTLPYEFGNLFGEMVNEYILPNVKTNLKILLERVIKADGKSFELHYYYPKLLDKREKQYDIGEKLWALIYPDLPYDPNKSDPDNIIYTIGVTGNRDWLIQIQVRSDEIEEFHVRDVWSEKESDYVDGNRYVKRPSFKFYQDRGWSLDFQDKLHMTALGSVYGDSRDQGYVISASGITNLNKSSYIGFYHSIELFFSMLSSWALQITEGD